MKLGRFVYLLIGALGLCVSQGLHAQQPALPCARTTDPHPFRYVILLELAGGNDGLNTVVPYKGQLYYDNRPSIGIGANAALPISDSLALHPALKGLLPLWKEKEMAVIVGIGYPGQNRSHFRSMDIWETASDANQVLKDGWVTRAMAADPDAETEFLAYGVLLGEERSGPLRGTPNVLAMQDVKSFLEQAATLEKANQESVALRSPSGDKSDLGIWARSRQVVLDAALFLRNHPAQGTPGVYPATGLGKQFATAADLMKRGVKIPVIKATLRGFDTHAGQVSIHEKLFAELSDAVVALESDLEKAGLWDQVLVVTYSEFGRRVKENASQGTDHGAASVVFAWGGSVKGGLYGTYPKLDALEDGDIVSNIDFRRLWSTVLRFQHQELSPNSFTEICKKVLLRFFEPLDLLK